MAQRKGNPPPEAKNGILEYFLLGLLLLVVIVTAWTLFDNGLVDTVVSLIDSPSR